MAKEQLLGLTESQLADWCKEKGMPAFRGKQIFNWLQQKNVDDFALMTNLPKNMIEKLNDMAEIALPKIIREQLSGDGQTAKLLLEFADGVLVEIVIMVYRREQSKNRRTICISTTLRRSGSTDRAERAALSIGTYPWWSAPSTSIAVSNPRVTSLL